MEIQLDGSFGRVTRRSGRGLTLVGRAASVVPEERCTFGRERATLAAQDCQNSVDAANLAVHNVPVMQRFRELRSLSGAGLRRMALCLAVGALVACSDDDLGIEESVYVNTMSDLYRLQRDSGTQASRDSVLRIHRVSAAQLEEVARRLADDPERAARLWRVIDRQGRTPVTPETDEIIETP